MNKKQITGKEAAEMIPDKATVALSGFIGFGLAEEVLCAVEERFIGCGHPYKINLVSIAGLGGDGKRRGFNHFGHRGMVGRLYASNLSMAGKLAALVAADAFPAFPVDVAVIKGNTADEEGNISCEREALMLEQYEMAAAAKNSGGIVIAQVEKIVRKGTIHPKQVVVPGHLVDFLVLATGENGRQQFALDTPFEPSWSGDARIDLAEMEPMDPGIRRMIAKRAAKEVKDGDFINLGIGMPDGVSRILNEEGRIGNITMSVESGVIGGVPAPGLGTGASYNPEVILRQPDMFDYYDGGGIDFACLGGAQFDRHGNVNVSKYNGKITGPGGFINITQNAKKVCFVGTFTTGGLEVKEEDGKLKIVREGKIKKFCGEVEQITFSGRYFREKGKQKGMIITERAVFELTKDGVMLTEIAPGINLERDILGQMEFCPLIAEKLKMMEGIFT